MRIYALNITTIKVPINAAPTSLTSDSSSNNNSNLFVQTFAIYIKPLLNGTETVVKSNGIGTLLRLAFSKNYHVQYRFIERFVFILLVLHHRELVRLYDCELATNDA